MAVALAEMPYRASGSPYAETVGGILAAPEGALDYAHAKLTLDSRVDPSLDVEWTAAERDRMAVRALELAGSEAGVEARLTALRKLIYQSGPWNDHRPFAYDHDNVRGANVRVKLIAHYLATRRGDCVSMPVLFLILAEKLGIDMRLASAPNHVFLRYRGTDGAAIGLEATSGANPARGTWLRQVRPMSDRSVASGLYLRTLSRRESVALMAMTNVQHLRDSGRFEEGIAVCEAILSCNPRDGLALANMGGMYERMLRRDFLDRYRAQHLVPIHLQPRYQFLWRRNREAFASAFALGWEPDTG